MPVTANGSATSFGALPSSLGGSPSSALPSLNLPGLSMPSVNAQNLNTSPQQVYSLLSSSPQSLTSLIAPLLSQVFGTQANLMQPLFQQQGAQGAAQAQSNAQQRGLTGSSIEQAGIQSAYTQANQGYDQYLAGQLNNLVPAYTSAAQYDIGNQNSYYQNLAGAVGQNYSSQLQQQQFQNQMQTLLEQSSMTSNAQEMAGAFSGGGAALGGLLQGAGNAGGLSALFSDIRLKDNIQPIGQFDGMTVYAFDYKQDTPFDLPKGRRIGLMGHEVCKKRPDCVTLEKGYFKVDYSKLGKS